MAGTRVTTCLTRTTLVPYADVIQWQNSCFPSRQRGFDSRHPLAGPGRMSSPPPVKRSPVPYGKRSFAALGIVYELPASKMGGWRNGRRASLRS